MKRFAFALVFVALLAAGCGASSAPATVNGVDVERGEFLDQLSQLAKLNGEEGNSVSAAQGANLLTQRIIALLVAEDVARLGVPVTDADLAAASDQVGPIPPGISQDFYDFAVLVQANQTALSARISDATNPWYTAADVRNFYEQVKETKYVNYCSHHILVDTEAAANEILGVLANGGDFAQLAKERSTDTQSAAEGGDLGCVVKGSFVTEYETAVMAAQTGDLLGPVQSTYGYHIIKIDKDYGLQAFDDKVRQELSAALLTEQGWLQFKVYSSAIAVEKRFGSWSNSETSVIPPVDPTVK